MLRKRAHFKYYRYWFWAICFPFLFPLSLWAQDLSKSKQDSASSLFNINDTKLIKSINKVLDTNQNKLKRLINKKAERIQSKIDTAVNKKLVKANLEEMEKPLPYERLLNTKYTLGRRAYQNTVSQFNYLFNVEEEFNENLQKVRNEYQDDFSSLISFYDYDLASTAKHPIDSMVYRCNANIVLHDLRSNYVDDAYLMLAKAYLFHKNFDTAASLLQFINYSFDEKENGADVPIGSNVRNTKGKFSIATLENNRLWENRNRRNESMLWQARNYFEMGDLNEGISLLQLLASDALFPKRLQPFLNEQMAYGYYLMELNDKAATALENALPNALDATAKTRWYYLIAQLWEKSENLEKAYSWYKKAAQNALNPRVSVYANIAMIVMDAKNSSTPWIELAYSLEKMLKRGKYKPYTDIIYFEMAKLAVQNKSYQHAIDWLIYSIKKNNNNFKLKQKAFELLANINYTIEAYTLSRIAYDSLMGVLKTNPNFDLIELRKKWMKEVDKNDKIIKLNDTLQFIYQLVPYQQEAFYNVWKKRSSETDSIYANLFLDNSSKPILPFSFEENTNPTLINNYNNNSKNSDFYFENNIAVQLGKQIFINKWGDRPNVDQWRRKSSTDITNQNNKNGNRIIPNESDQPSSNPIEKATVNPEMKGSLGKANDTLSIILIKDEFAFSNSLTAWNVAALANAQVFLLQLNDFEKAYPIYEKIIKKNIDPVVTERALLDLASHYVHESNLARADSLIQLVLKQFPNGFYVTKKKAAFDKINKEKALVEDYKEAYFFTQIGNWDSFSNKLAPLNTGFKGTKWYYPFQFLKVKMYAQQKKDSLAVKLLDSIISNSKNEKIKDKATNILTEINKRKTTEYYLDTLRLKKAIIALPFVHIKEDASLFITPPSSLPQTTTIVQKLVSKDNPTLTIKSLSNVNDPKKFTDSLVTAISFENDSLEPHYIALITNKVSASFVKEIQNAFQILNSDEFFKLKLNVTYIQFDDFTYIVWIGSFDNRLNANSYLNKIKPKLSKEIISFIPTKQYQLYLFGKSNINLIKSSEDLKKYEQFMIQTIYKP